MQCFVRNFVAFQIVYHIQMVTVNALLDLFGVVLALVMHQQTQLIRQYVEGAVKTVTAAIRTQILVCAIVV